MLPFWTMLSRKYTKEKNIKSIKSSAVVSISMELD